MFIIISNDNNICIWKFKWKVAIAQMFSNNNVIVIIPYEFRLVLFLTSTVFAYCLMATTKMEEYIHLLLYVM